MRKILGPILVGLGGFLIAAAVLTTVWAPGVVKKTPIDVNTLTRLSGTVEKLDTATGKLVPNEVKVTSITKADSGASDDDVVAFVNTSCVVIDDGTDVPDCVSGEDARLITASTDVFATDRVTALAVDGKGYLPDDAVPHEGLVNKWPFDAEKKTYPYWDGTSGEAVDAVYDRTDDVDGVEVYVYKVTITDAPIEIAKGVNGTYTDSKEIYVEPKTGDILNQTDDQQRYLDDGTQVLDLKIGFTDAQQAKSSSDAKDNVAQLDLILRTVPLVGYLVGIPLLILGVVLMVLLRRRKEPETAPTEPAVTEDQQA